MNAGAGAVTAVFVLALAGSLHLAWDQRLRRGTHRRLTTPRTDGGGGPPTPAATGSWPAPVDRRWAPTGLGPALQSADVTWPAPTVWRSWLAATVTTVGAAVAVGGPGLGLVIGALGVAAPPALLWALAGRRDERLERALPDVLEATARALRSGASLRGALAEAAAGAPAVVATELAAVVDSARAGTGLTAALDAWATARPLPGVRLAVAAVGLSAGTGGASAQALDGVAATLRDRLALGREVRALSSQARISALVIALAPLGFAVLAVGVDGTTAEFLLRTRAGLACLSLGLALNGVAAWWMARITRGAT